MHPKTLAGLAAFATCAALGWFGASTARPANAATNPAPPPATPDLGWHSVGASRQVELNLSVSGIEGSAGARHATVDLGVRNNFDGAAKVQYAVEIVDDLGKPVSPIHTSPKHTLSAHGAEVHETLSTPIGGLPDGYYKIRVTAAGLSSNLGATSNVAWHFQVAHGDVIEMEKNDWDARSRAMGATR